VPSLLNGIIKVAASKLALFSVSGLKDENLIIKQTYLKTETYKRYSGVF